MSKLPGTLAKQAIGFIFVLILYLSALPFLTAGPVVRDATAAPNDATIFTGQIIPAFIGGAYDPSEAFKKLAGLPVYVVAYDNWGQANKIKNNLAVRTQIRADGTFQAAGLPTAAHYGVYFPFRRGSNGAERSDGLSEGTQTAEFRWPELGDQIIDVFSYSFADGSGITVKDQLGNDVTLGQLFTTTTTRVDKENNINVFPVVPVKTLKITVQAPSDFSYEVYAQRVTTQQALDFGDGEEGLLYPVLNFPVIKGRTSPAPNPVAGFSTHTFQAYAPQGIYAITVWRSEEQSFSYKDWDGKSPLNSQRNGFAVLKVHQDWQTVLGDTNIVPTEFGRVTLWGTVTNSQGLLMSDANSVVGLADVDVNINSYTQLNFAARSQKGNQGLDFYTPGISESLPDHTVWGIYMIAESLLGGSPQQILNADGVCLYVDQAGYRASPAKPNQNIIYSHYGPRRVNLKASSSVQGNASGYDRGVVLKIVDHANNPITDAIVRVGTTEDTQNFPIPALGNTYTSNCVGQVYIPDNHLKREQDYLLEIRSGRRVKYHPFTYPGEGYYDNQGAAIVPQKPPQSAYSGRKLFGIIPLPFANAYANEDTVTIEGLLLLEEALTGFEVSFSGFSENKFFGRDGRCPPDECYIIDESEGQVVQIPPDNWDPQPPEHEFKVVLPVPASPAEAKTKCEDIGGIWDKLITLNCSIFNDRSVNTSTYRMEIKAQNPNAKKDEDSEVTRVHNLTVRSDGTATAQVTADFSIACGDRFPLGLNVVNWGGRFMNRSACEFGRMFIQKATSLMDSVQHWLFIRPLTQEKGIIDLWETVRNLTNLVFVLMLIAIGVASILRIEPESWSPSILIPRLLLAVVVANFSLLIVQGLIDLTNILTNGVFSLAKNILISTAPEQAGRSITGAAGVAGGALAAKAVLGILAAKLSVMGVSMLATVIGTSANPVFAMPLLSAAIGIFFTILLFLLGLVILFYTRYFAIWAMVVAAPAVWAAQVLPLELTQTLKEKWQATLITFTFMQPLIAAVLAVGLLLLSVVGSDNSFIGGFGIAIMGVITLLSVLKVPSMMSEFAGGGFISTEGLGQAPEGLREKVFGKEGLMEEKFSTEKLAKGYRTAVTRGSSNIRAFGQSLFGTATGRLQQEEQLEELVKESEPLTPPKVKADIEFGKDKLVRKINVNLKQKIPKDQLPQGVKMPSTHRGEAPDLKTYFQMGTQSQRFTYRGQQTSVPDFLEQHFPNMSRGEQAEAATEHLVGMKGGGWDTLQDRAAQTPQEQQQFEESFLSAMHGAKTFSHQRG